MEETNDKIVLEAITKRIFQFVETEGLSYADFAASLDIGAAVISHMKNGRNKVSLNVYAKILDSFPKLNPDWLLLGQGSMYRTEHNEQQSLGGLFGSSAVSNSPSTSAKEKPVEQFVQTVAPAKQIKKIVVFYDDNSFQELIP